MKKSLTICYRCEGTKESAASDLYGYPICDTCRTEMKLMLDTTVKRHATSFEKAKAKHPDLPTYEEDVRNKLRCLDKDYINKKIRLLHIQERLGYIK